MPRVSILMPVYNASKYLKEAIDSIISQTYTDWELVIINDGSTDDSETIITSYSDSRLRYYKNVENIGLIRTLNKGIELCEGDYIARMDSDDISMPDRIMTQVKFLDEYPEYVMCGSNAIVIDGAGNLTGKIINLGTNKYLQINLLFSVPFVHPSVMIRSQALNDNPYDLDYKYAEDYDLWCRLADKYEVANVPEFLLMYRWHDTNVSSIRQKEQDEIKNKIIKRQIEGLGIIASERDLFLHRVTFQQYDAKLRGKPLVFNEYSELNLWFQKIVKANKTYSRYDSGSLDAYLWSRWVVLCISQKKYFKICRVPSFLRFNLSILEQTFRLLLFFSKK